MPKYKSVTSVALSKWLRNEKCESQFTINGSKLYCQVISKLSNLDHHYFVLSVNLNETFKSCLVSFSLANPPTSLELKAS